MPSSERQLSERLPMAVSALGLFVLSFLGGAATISFEWFPYDALFRPAFDTIESFEQRWTTWNNSAIDTYLWHETDASDGAVVSREEEAALGYTFYSSGHVTGGLLVGLGGRPVHRWSVPFETLWSDPPHISSRAPGTHIYWEDVELFSDGALLAVYAAAEERPRGYGLAKIGPKSNVRWRVPLRAHDDVTIGREGRIWVLTHGLTKPKGILADRLPNANRPALIDEVVSLSSDGERRQSIRLDAALADATHSKFLRNVERDRTHGPLAASSLAVAGEKFAATHSFVRRGQLVVALAGLDALAVLAPDEGEITWVQQGPWRDPRSLSPRPNGDIVLLDVSGGEQKRGGSRVLRYDPGERSVEWQFRGTSKRPLSTTRHGSQRVLPNGNILISDSDSGRIVEVVPGRGVVWRFVNPERGARGSVSYRPAVFAADRADRASLDFELNLR